MLLKILKADLAKKKIITLILTFFVMLSSFLMAASFSMIAELISALDSFFTKSSAPHYVQMHEGNLNVKQITQWAAGQSYLKKQQFVEMLLVDDAHVYIGHNTSPEKGSVMNLDFVTQNKQFDYLLNLNNEVVQPKSGEIAVPIYFMQHNHLKIGDKIKINNKDFNKELTITDFIRDVQMNPSIIHSKRFVISSKDFDDLKKSGERSVHLIEFQLSDLAAVRAFSSNYQLSNLPKNGPSIDYQLYKVLNSITDGIIIGMILLMSFLLTLIAILCLRFIINTTIEEDFKQIGVMKAIGIEQNTIKKLYLAKYALVAFVACAVGYVIALVTKKLFLTNISLYFGLPPSGLLLHSIPLLAVGFVFLIMILSCKLVLRKFNRISAVAALREGASLQRPGKFRLIALKKKYFLNLNIFIGLRDVVQKYHSYLLLFFVFVIASFIVILPLNFYSTIKSPGFISYMGVGKSDIRIDIRHSISDQKLRAALSKLDSDQDLKQYAVVRTARYRVMNDDNSFDNINIDSGDFALFPVKYLNGNAPADRDQISLSYLNSKQLQKKVGDRVKIIIDHQPKQFLVTGIYQDITNGGKTAKALLPSNPVPLLWAVVNIDLKPNVSIQEKLSEYQKIFYPARVTNIEGYLQQTLGELITQIKKISFLALLVAITLSILITSMFLKMLIAKHHADIAIMKALGFSVTAIQTQYLARSLFVLNLGILCGAILANTLGQSIVSLVWSFMGASSIQLITNPIEAYLICPLLLILVVAVTTLASIIGIKRININEMVVE